VNVSLVPEKIDLVCCHERDVRVSRLGDFIPKSEEKHGKTKPKPLQKNINPLAILSATFTITP